MNKSFNISPAGYSKAVPTFGLMVKICGHMAPALDLTLETVKIETFGARVPDDVDLTLYPVDKDGQARLEAGIEAAASVVEQTGSTIRLAFKTSTYPLSKLIVRCLAARQGIEPYHSKIGL